MQFLTLSSSDFNQAPKEVAVVADRVFNSGSIKFRGLSTPPFPFDYEPVSSSKSQPSSCLVPFFFSFCFL